MKTYVDLRPHDVFGRNYLGYLYYCLEKYDEAIAHLNKAVELRPDNCYAYAKLSRAYAGLYLEAADLDPRRTGYRQKAQQMFEKASTTESSDPLRVKWLMRYLQKKGILD